MKRPLQRSEAQCGTARLLVSSFWDGFHRRSLGGVRQRKSSSAEDVSSNDCAPAIFVLLHKGRLASQKLEPEAARRLGRGVPVSKAEIRFG